MESMLKTIEKDIGRVASTMENTIIVQQPLFTKQALMEHDLALLKEHIDKQDARIWQIKMALIGAILSAIVAIGAILVKG